MFSFSDASFGAGNVVQWTTFCRCYLSVAAAAALLLFSTVLCLLTTATSARAVMTSPTRWLAPCSGASDVTGRSRDDTADVMGISPTTSVVSNDDLTSMFRKISVKMKRLKSRVRELKNIYVSLAIQYRC